MTTTDISPEGFDALRSAVNYARDSRPLKVEDVSNHLLSIGYKEIHVAEAINAWADYLSRKSLSSLKASS